MSNKFIFDIIAPPGMDGDVGYPGVDGQNGQPGLCGERGTDGLPGVSSNIICSFF